jgi:hypothetical protein
MMVIGGFVSEVFLSLFTFLFWNRLYVQNLRNAVLSYKWQGFRQQT